MLILISVQKDGSTLMKVVTSSTMKVWVYFVNEKYLIKCHAKRLHIILVKVSWREGQSICESFGGFLAEVRSNTQHEFLVKNKTKFFRLRQLKTKMTYKTEIRQT